MTKKNKPSKSKVKRVKKSHLNNIIYFDAIVGNKALLKKYDQKIEQLREGLYQEANLEKLHGHDIYSIRINQSDRLLFVRAQYKGKSYFILLEEVLNHDYDKSRFLIPSVLKAYREHKIVDVIEESLAFESYNGALFSSEIQEKSEVLEEKVPQRVSFYNRFYIPSEEQNEAVFAKKTSVIFGPPGTGKSGSALDVLVRIALKANINNPLKLLYIAPKKLIEEMSQKFKEHPLIHELQQNPCARVAFNTFAELCGIPDEPSELKETASCLSAKERSELVITWLKRYRNKLKNIEKAIQSVTPLKDNVLKDLSKVYAEFRILAPYYKKQEKDKYLSLGNKQTCIEKKSSREIIYKAFEAYVEGNTQYDLALVPPPIVDAAEFHLIVVDEAQDLSPIQIQWLFEKAKDHQIRFFCSHDQLFFNSIFNQQSFTSILPDCPIHFIQFSECFRSPGVVTALVKRAVKAKLKISGNSDKLENHPLNMIINNKPGNLVWLDPDNLPADFFVDSDTPVLCREEDKNKASLLFNTKFVCTAIEFKGRERKKVIVYNILSGDAFKEICQLLLNKEGEPSGHRAKNKNDENYDKAFNEFITAITRGFDEVLMVQNRWHWLTPLMKELQPEEEKKILLKENEKKIPTVEIKTEKMPTENDWMQSAKKLYLEDKLITQAKAIVCETLGKSETEFKTLCAMWEGEGKELSYSFTANQKVKDSTVSSSVLPTTQKEEKRKTGLTPEKLKKFADDFSKACTEENFQRIFKDPHFKKIFFGPFENNKECSSLFQIILRQNDMMRVLLSFFKNKPEYQKQITGYLLSAHPVDASNNKLMPPLFWMVLSSLGFSLFKNLSTSSDFNLQISADAFFCQSNTPYAYEGLSVFFCLSMQEENCKILHKCLIDNPLLITNMPLNALIQPLAKYTEEILLLILTHLNTENSNKYRNCTAIYYLSQNATGIKIIEMLLHARSDFIQEKVLQAILIHTNTSEDEASSAWDNLYQDPVGIEILKKLAPDSLLTEMKPKNSPKPLEMLAIIDDQKDIKEVKEIATEELQPLKHELADIHAFGDQLMEDFTTEHLKKLFEHKYFNYLLFEMEDRLLHPILDDEYSLEIFVTFLLDKNNLWAAKGFTAERLCRNEGDDMPPLYEIARRKKGSQLIIYLLSIFDSFTITKDAFFQNSDEGDSAFNVLCVDDIGCAILQGFFKKNPRLILGITTKRLTTHSDFIRDISNKNICLSPLDLLCAHHPGIEILQMIATYNNSIIQSIDKKSWPRSFNKDKLKISKPLAESPETFKTEDHVILAYRNKLLEEFTSLQLQNYLKLKGLFSKVFSPEFVYELSKNPQHKVKLLNFLMDVDNIKAAKLFKADFLSALIETEDNSMSLLFLLFDHPPPDSLVVNWFIYLLKIHKPFKINPETLFTQNKNGQSLFNLLAAHGVNALYELFSKNNALYEKMTLSFLCKRVTSSSSNNSYTSFYTNHCPLYFLIKTEKGCNLVEKALTENSNLIHDLTSEFFYHNEVGDDDCSKFDSVLQQLSSTKFGRKLLVFLFTKKPELVASIPYKAWVDIGQMNHSAVFFIHRSKCKTLMDLLPFKEPIVENKKINLTKTMFQKGGRNRTSCQLTSRFEYSGYQNTKSKVAENETFIYLK